MKANEFIKKHGISEVTDFLDWIEKNKAIDAPDDFRVTVFGDDISYKTLKKLVEAHQIIKLFKSLDHAKAEAQACERSKHSEILVKLDVGVGYIWLSRVKQAIADVESCMEVSSESN